VKNCVLTVSLLTGVVVVLILVVVSLGVKLYEEKKKVSKIRLELHKYRLQQMPRRI